MSGRRRLFLKKTISSPPATSPPSATTTEAIVLGGVDVLRPTTTSPLPLTDVVNNEESPGRTTKPHLPLVRAYTAIPTPSANFVPLDRQQRHTAVYPRQNFTTEWLNDCNFDQASSNGYRHLQKKLQRQNAFEIRHQTANSPDRTMSRNRQMSQAPPCYEAESGRQMDSDDETALAAGVVLAKDDSAAVKRRNSEVSTIESATNVEEESDAARKSNASGDNTSRRWYNNANARSSLSTAFTVFYCLCVTIFALVIELAHLLSEEKRRHVRLKDLIFGLYMYGVGILFFMYCYAVLLLNPRWMKALHRFKQIFRRGPRITNSPSDCKMESECVGTSIAAATIHRKVSHDNPSAGSLYLRLGCVIFGIIGVVYYSFSAFLCISDRLCDNLTSTVDIAGITFIFIQMHFVFCNSKMSITGSHMIARFGTMHLIAANLWTWIRYVLIEESVMTEEIRDIFNNGRNASTPTPLRSMRLHDASNSMEMPIVRSITRIPSAFGSHEAANAGGGSDASSTLDDSASCLAAECILGSLSEIMYTSIVEYSLIGAAVMFIVWRNIGHAKQSSAAAYVKRKHQIRVDCSKTTTGLFLGFAYLAATFTSMAVFYGYSISGHNHTAAMVYAVTDVVQYVVAGFGCIYALWKMRLLRYYEDPSLQCGDGPSGTRQELLDKILLSLGLTGELIHSVAGLVGLTGEKAWTPLAFVLLTVHITRLIQVGMQSCLIYIASKLRIHGDDSLRQSQPGKQTITFLLIANIAMFLMNLFEAEKAGVSKTVVNFYGKKSWVFLVRSFSPLTIFYRFHSSVCLAEIFKHTYAWKSA